jgi:hypothetical protein
MTYATLVRSIASFLFVVPLLAAASTAGCGGGQQADTSSGFRLGAYDNCSATTFLQVPGGGGELGIAGSVTLAQSGSVLTVSYGGDGGAFNPSSLQFSEASSTSATLAAGQQISGVSVPCAPLDFAPSVAKLASGSLTYNAGTLFVSVEGADEPVDAGAGCSNPGGKASILITCSDDAGAQPTGTDAGSSGGGVASDFVGVYSCVSSAVSSKSATPQAYETVSSNDPGTMGTLTITDAGDGVLTAAYANDMFVEGSMQFVATTGHAAVPATTNQTMQVSCSNPWAPVTGNGNPVLESMPVTASTLTLDGSWVVLSVFGEMTSSSTCPGAETFVSLLCSR